MAAIPHLRLAAAVLVGGLYLWPAAAQEPPNAISATSPSPGHFIFKEQVRYTSFRLDEGRFDRRREIDDVQLKTTLSFGLTPDWSLSLTAPVIFREERYDFGDRGGRDAGVADLQLLAKWRFWKDDSTALNTKRLALVTGLEMRTGDNPFTGDSYDPILGLAYTQISGRHGLNAAALWTFNTGGVADAVMPGMSTADLLTADLAYSYRLWPLEYAADTPGALYAIAELNGLYETNGDAQLFASPALMWEATHWVFSLSVQLPVWQDLTNRPETDYVIAAEVRFSF